MPLPLMFSKLRNLQIKIDIKNFLHLFVTLTVCIRREDPGVKSRICAPYPQGVVKGDLKGWFLGITVLKEWPRVGAWTGTLKNLTKCLWRWEPDRMFNFFNLPAHLLAVTYITEISLNVTLKNQSQSLSLRPYALSVVCNRIIHEWTYGSKLKDTYNQ